MKALILIFSLLVFREMNARDREDAYTISDQHLLLIQMALDSIYNLNFGGADKMIRAVEDSLPDYSGTFLLKIYYLIWKNRPVLADHADFPVLLALADSVLLKASNSDIEDPKGKEGIFFTLSIHAILARVFVDSGNNWKALLQARKAYKYIKVGLELTDDFSDLNLYCGIYNYYREKYPDDNPFMRPFVAFFMNGSKEEGMQMLDQGAKHGLFTKVECLTYLYHIHLRYEFEPTLSIDPIRQLHKLYPKNENFTALFVENLIYMEEFEQLDSLIWVIEQSRMPYYKYVGKIYRGLHFELALYELDSAKHVFREAQSYGAKHNVTSPHYESLNYLGAGRVRMKMGDSEGAKKYLKSSAKISDYSFVRDEAKRLLDKL